MPFDYPEEEQDEVEAPPQRAQRTAGLFPARRVVSGSDPSSAVFPHDPANSLNDAQFQRRYETSPTPISKLGIGQRIVAMGQGSSWPYGANGREVATKSVGNRILAGVRGSMDSWQIPRLKLGPGISPVSLNFDQAQGQQGTFGSFIPVSEDRAFDSQKPIRRLSEPSSNAYSLRPADAFQSPVLAKMSNMQRPKTSTATSVKGSRGAATKGQTGVQDAVGQKGQQKEAAKRQGNQPQSLPELQLPQLLQTEQHPAERALFSNASEAARNPPKPPDPSWTEIREYIAQEARAYGIPVKLAEAVVRHETNFDIHSKVVVPGHGIDWGIMAVNSSNKDRLAGPQGWGFQVDTERVKNDWKYNVHVGMAILKKAYAAAAFNNVGEENIARETYARYNAHRTWKQLYSVPKGKISQHVDQFMKSWHRYYDEK